MGGLLRRSPRTHTSVAGPATSPKLSPATRNNAHTSRTTGVPATCNTDAYGYNAGKAGEDAENPYGNDEKKTEMQEVTQ